MLPGLLVPPAFYSAPGCAHSMAPEMDQFYRSTMAIYKVSVYMAQAPAAAPAPRA